MEKKEKYGFRKHKAVKGLGVALLGTVSVLAGSSLISANEVSISEAVRPNQVIDAKVRRVNVNDLTAEQKARIKTGKIDEQTSWVNTETGNFEWITGFVAVYKSAESSQIVPIEPDTQQPNDSSASKVTVIPARSVHSILPKAGSASSKAIMVTGFGLLTFGGYLLFKNRKTGKKVAIALLVAGGVGVSTPTLANSTTFLDLVENVTLQLDSRFTHTPGTDTGWEYVGYYVETASVPVDSPPKTDNPTPRTETNVTETKGSVVVRYQDDAGNTLKSDYQLVTDRVVTRTTVNKTYLNDVLVDTDTKVENIGGVYNAAPVKEEKITTNDGVYVLTGIKGVEIDSVVEGTTEVIYVYSKLETSTKEVRGTVITRYINEATGEEIVPSTTIIDNQVVATKEVTEIKAADGTVLDTQTVTTPTYLLYNTTLDKAAKDKIIAQMLTSPVEFLNTNTGVTEQIVNNTITTGTRELAIYVVKSDLAVLEQNSDYQEQATARGFDVATEVETFIEDRTDIVDGVLITSKVYKYTYTKEITEEAPKVPYVFSRVDVVEVDYVKEGQTVVTYYYKPASLSVTPTVEYDSIGLTQSTVAA
ncbi:TPA: putative cross-wall-targeting lipoprotein signal domain-containing protein [Streptococcus suis]